MSSKSAIWVAAVVLVVTGIVASRYFQHGRAEPKQDSREEFFEATSGREPGRKELADANQSQESLQELVHRLLFTPSPGNLSGRAFVAHRGARGPESRVAVIRACARDNAASKRRLLWPTEAYYVLARPDNNDVAVWRLVDSYLARPPASDEHEQLHRLLARLPRERESQLDVSSLIRRLKSESSADRLAHAIERFLKDGAPEKRQAVIGLIGELLSTPGVSHVSAALEAFLENSDPVEAIADLAWLSDEIVWELSSNPQWNGYSAEIVMLGQYLSLAFASDRSSERLPLDRYKEEFFQYASREDTPGFQLPVAMALAVFALDDDAQAKLSLRRLASRSVSAQEDILVNYGKVATVREVLDIAPILPDADPGSDEELLRQNAVVIALQNSLNYEPAQAHLAAPFIETVLTTWNQTAFQVQCRNGVVARLARGVCPRSCVDALLIIQAGLDGSDPQLSELLRRAIDRAQ